MNKRLKQNRNLTVITDGKFNEIDIRKMPLAKEYLNNNYKVLESAVNHYSRLTIISLTLNFPSKYFDYENPLIKTNQFINRMIKSLQGQIDSYAKRKSVDWSKRVSCRVRYSCAKEQDTSSSPHYHMVLVLNRELFYGLGDYSYLQDNLASMCIRAWASSLGLDEQDTRGLVHFDNKKPVHHLSRRDFEFTSLVFQETFYAMSYLAKIKTKHWGNKNRSFTTSRG